MFKKTNLKLIRRWKKSRNAGKFVHSKYSCTLTSQVSVQFLCPTKLLIIAIIKCLSYSKISAIMCSLFSVLFLFNLGKHVHKWEKILSSLLNMTLGTSCIIGPFLCCHLLYLIIYLLFTICDKKMTVNDTK